MIGAAEWQARWLDTLPAWRNKPLVQRGVSVAVFHSDVMGNLLLDQGLSTGAALLFFLRLSCDGQVSVEAHAN